MLQWSGESDDKTLGQHLILFDLRKLGQVK